MIEQLKAMTKYEAYKNSDVEWLGKIPSHWNVKPGLTVFSENKRDNRGMKEIQVLSLSYGSIIVKPVEKLVGLVPESFETYQLVEPGDIIVRCTDLQNDQTSLRTGLARDKGIITSAYLNLKVRKGHCPRYWHYYLHSLDTTKVIYKFGSGLRQNLSFLDFKRLPIFDIALTEQTAIAAFLDRKTVQIDQAVAIKDKQIALLKERKQILIQNAVTRGLNPDAPMRDSGVEWIGEIPAHWDVKPVTKYATRVDYRGKTPDKVEEGIFLVTTKNIKDGQINYIISQEFIAKKRYQSVMARGLPKIGDILFTMEAPLGMSAIVDNEEIAIAQRIIKFRFNTIYLLSKFVNYSIQAGYFQDFLQRIGTGSTALGIKASKLNKLKLIQPSVAEQSAIVARIETESAKIDRAITLQQQQIDKLKEYKATLINSAVTGKIKVA